VDLVVRSGSPAPGTTPGVFFGDIQGMLGNGQGQVAFFSGLRGEGVDETNGSGLWATDPQGELVLIARTGDLLEVLPGDFRRIEHLSAEEWSGGGDGRRVCFSENGELAFKAEFTDGSNGIFVAFVPEPATVTLLGIALAGAFYDWRRRKREEHSASEKRGRRNAFVCVKREG
jgi:hypothetical protein